MQSKNDKFTTVTKSGRLIDFYNSDWFFPDSTDKLIWTCAYHTYDISSSDLSHCLLIEDFGTCLLVSGDLEYIDKPSKYTVHIDGKTIVKFELDPSVKHTGNGIWLVIMLPVPNENGSENHGYIRDRCLEMLAFIRVFLGFNIAVEEKFSYTINYDTKRRSITSDAFRNLSLLPKPDTSFKQITSLQSAYNKIRQYDEGKRQKTILSLRWYSKAQNQLGVDSFLSYWIAIEVLCMEDTNIQPIKQRLCEIREIDISRYEETMIGKLFNLRTEIVHSGLSKGIYNYIITYIDAIYVDLLYYSLGLENKKEHMRVLKEHPEIGEYLRDLLSNS